MTEDVKVGPMKPAEIDALLNMLDTFAEEDGGYREQACFYAAKTIRRMQDALEPLWQRARTPGADRVPDNGTVTVFMLDCREAAEAAGR